MRTIKYLALPALLILASRTASSQQVAPTSNLPDATVQTPGSVSSYPELVNYSNTGLRNFVRQFTPTKATDNPALVELTGASLISLATTTYYDGLGRPMQTVGSAAAGSRSDLVKVFTYDLLGRQRYDYLPFTKDETIYDRGKLKENPLTDLSTQYDLLYKGDPPYQWTEFDNSPLNRVVKSTPPGASWMDNGIGKQTRYETIASGTWSVDGPSHFTIASTGINDLPTYLGAYQNSELIGETTIDEDGKRKSVYQDLEGRMVCQRQELISNWVTPPSQQYLYSSLTSYVYDDMGRLRMVIPPMALKISFPNITQAIADSLCFRYWYDERGRLVERKIPGKALEYLVYDGMDRLVLTQDGNLRAGNKWAYTTYDRLSRPLSTGIYLPGGAITRQQLEMDLTAAGSSYTTSNLLYYLYNLEVFDEYPVAASDRELLTEIRYDGYNNAPAAYTTAPNSQLAWPSPMPALSLQTRGLPTVSSSRVLDGTGNSTWLHQTSYYDDKNRPIQVHSNNLHAGGGTVTTNQYDFDGVLISSVLSHSNSDATSTDPANPGMLQNTSIVKRYSRAISGNINKLEQNIGSNGFRDVFSLTWDPLGRVLNKKLSATDNVYSYNIRGWLTGINKANITNNNSAKSSHFHESISYDNGFESKNYNGNISGIIWRNSGAGASRNFYGYTYDGLDRLTHAEHQEELVNTSSWIKTRTDFTVSNLSYDESGNILTMDQRGPGPSSPVNMDMLRYNYWPNSNKLRRVYEALGAATSTAAPDFKDGFNSGDDYNYDANGNLTIDLNKNINTPITYSYQDKPVHVDVQGKGSVDYLYSGSGQLLRKYVYNQSSGNTDTTEYDGPFVYENCMLHHITTEEGRCRPRSLAVSGQASYDYDYFVKDHLQNVRAVVNAQLSGLSSMFQYLTGLEVGLAKREGLVWSHLDDVRTYSPAPTGPLDGYSAELDGQDPNKRVGTAVMLRTMPGDAFDVSGRSYYQAVNQNNANNAQEFASSLLSALSGGSLYNNIPVTETPQNMAVIQNTVGNPQFAMAYDDLVNANTDMLYPASHLNYLFFDDQFQLDATVSGAVQCGAIPNQWNTVGNSSRIEIDRPGYILFFTGSKVNSSVYWDQIDVKHYKGEVIEENHYYPFGLTLNTASGNSREKNNYRLTTKEIQDEHGLNWYDFGARMQDMQIGRWIQIDKCAESFKAVTPYAFVSNTPTIAVDMDGNYTTDAKTADKYKNFTTYLRQNVKNDMMSSPTIMSAFKKYSGGNLTRNEVSKATAWGTGPKIVVDPAPGGYNTAAGYYDSKTKTIKLNTAMVEAFENAKPEDRQAALLSLYAVLGHETVHYGDYLDGQRQTDMDPSGFGGEPGTAFTRNVFFTSKVTFKDGTSEYIQDYVSDYYDTVDPQAHKDFSSRFLERLQRSGDTDLIPTLPTTQKKEQR